MPLSGLGRDGAGDVRAVDVALLTDAVLAPPVAVAAGAGLLAADELDPRHEAAGEVGVAEVDTGVDDRDDDTLAAVVGPCLLGVHLVEAVERVAQRVVGRGARGAGEARVTPPSPTPRFPGDPENLPFARV